MIDASWRRAVDIGEAPHLADTGCGRGSFLASHNLSVLHAGLGDEAQAQGWRERAVAQRAAQAAQALERGALYTAEQSPLVIAS